MKRFFAILMILGGGIGGYFAAAHVLWQHRAIHEFVPVDAQIVESHVQVNRGKSTTYTPKATYRYTYNGSAYESTRILPVDESGGSTWAHGIVARLNQQQWQGGVEAGAPKAKAYVNPDNPQESVLIREYSFSPYGLAMVSLSIAAIGAGLFAGVIAGGRDTMAAVALDDSGWQLLLPARSLRRRFGDSAAWLAATALVAIPLMLHWFLVAGQRSAAGTFWGSVAGALLLGLLLIMLRRWSLSRHISDARVRVKPVPMKRGDVFLMEVEADALSILNVKEMRGQVVCIEHYREKRGNKTQVGTRTKGEQSMQLCGEASVPAGQVVEGKGELFFAESGLPPTTDLPVKIYPYYRWEIRISVKLAGMVDYAGVFPLEVE